MKQSQQQHDRPQGRELVACKKFREIETKLQGLNKKLQNLIPHFYEAEADFALAAVRTNGDGRLSTVADCLSALQEYRKGMAKALSMLQKADAAVQGLLEGGECLMASFGTCPRCKGAKGRRVTPYGPWQDCVRCSGRGFLILEARKAAVRNNFLTLLLLCLMVFAGCAQLARPGIVNLRLKAEGEEVHQQAQAIAAWQGCVRQYGRSWQQDPKTETGQPVSLDLVKLGVLHVCGAYPGHAYNGTAQPDEKGVNLMNINPATLPLVGPLLQ